MQIIPAIDLRDGRCVRLVQGEKDKETVYSDEPVEMAKSWEKLGAKILHVVDLDGAFAGSPKNLSVIKEMVQAINIPIQLGGGIRTIETVREVLDMGIDRVILGTAAITNSDLVKRCCEEYGDRIVVGIDGKDGMVAIEGWESTVGVSVESLAQDIAKLGIERIIFTDTRRDGMLQGPNVEATKNLAEASGLKVIASGGVSSLEDLKAIKSLESCGVEGIIVGKALYSGAISMNDALAVMED